MLGKLLTRNFALLWLGQGISQFGDHVARIAFVTLIYEKTHSTSAVGMLFVIDAIAGMALGLVAGILVDRLDRKAIMVLSDVARAVLVLSLLWFSSLFAIYAVSVLMTFCSVIFTPAKNAFIPQVVPGNDLPRANAASSTLEQIMVIGGPIAGTAIVGFFSTGAAFAVDTISFLVSIATLAAIAIPGRAALKETAAASDRAGYWAEARTGFRVISRSSVLRALLLAEVIAVLGVGAVNVLLVGYANDVLHVAASNFGWLVSTLGVGLVAGSVLAGLLGDRLRAGTAGASMGLLGCAVAALAVVHVVPVAMGLFLAIGITNAIYNVVSTTILQRETADETRGRVFSGIMAATSAASLLAMGLSGVAADAVGIPAVFTAAGAVIVLAGLFAFTQFRRGTDRTVSN